MLRNCGECGRLFAGHASLCLQCADRRETEFAQVRDYLRRHPAADIHTVTEATGVSRDRILLFLREGWLIHAPAGAQIHCEVCNASVSRGRLCQRCAVTLQRQWGVPGADGPDGGVKMYSADRYSRRLGARRPFRD